MISNIFNNDLVLYIIILLPMIIYYLLFVIFKGHTIIHEMGHFFVIKHYIKKLKYENYDVLIFIGARCTKDIESLILNSKYSYKFIYFVSKEKGGFTHSKAYNKIAFDRSEQQFKIIRKNALAGSLFNVIFESIYFFISLLIELIFLNVELYTIVFIIYFLFSIVYAYASFSGKKGSITSDKAYYKNPQNFINEHIN